MHQKLRSDLWGSPPGKTVAQVTPQRGKRNPNQDDERDGRDIFSKSEKWLSPMLTVDFRNWRTRADEVLRFSDWVQALRAWVSWEVTSLPGIRDSYVCAEARSTDSKCASSCNPYSDVQGFPKGEHHAASLY